MKKLFLLLMMSLLLPLGMMAGTHVNVMLTEAGTLQERLLDSEYDKIDSLTVSGKFNSLDLVYLNEAAGRIANMVYLDLTDIELVDSDEKYYTWAEFYGADGQSLGANRCYLQIPKRDTVSGARGEAESETPVLSDMIFSDEEDDIIAIPVYGSTNGEDDGTTGIDNNNREPITNNVWYNLQGQRVDKPGKGIYIHNGKVIVRK